MKEDADQMKAKRKRLTIILMTLLVILTLSIAYYFQFTGEGYRLTISRRNAFVEISDHIYLNKNFKGDKEEILENIQLAKERTEAFFGELKCLDKTILIICDDEKLLTKLGGDHDTMTYHFTPYQNIICVSEQYCVLDVLAHEYTHAELHSRLTVKALKRIPTWFDEGIAMQNDYRKQYNLEAWIKKTDHGKNVIALEDMDCSEEFNAGTTKDRRLRYIIAKHEVEEWLAENQVDGLLKLIDQLNQGEDFINIYKK